MFPLNDSQPNRYSSIPFMTLALIIVNAAILLVFSDDYTMASLGLYAFNPVLINQREGGGITTAITATFLHGGWSHLLSNMWILWVFGRRLEDACGSWRFLAYYLLAGIMGHIMTAVVTPNEFSFSIGASGAVFGVMSGYLLLFPEGRIRTWVIPPLPAWPRIRAGWIVLYFLGEQILPAIDIAFNGAMYGIGYWAHLGGFMTCVFVVLFLRPEAFARYLSNVPV